jgi:metal-responsive CopG/Arc/MetJ family transcriptional regulator
VALRKVVMHLDDEIVARLDRLAQAEGTSRSELLRRGAGAVVEAAEIAEADRQMRDSYRQVAPDPLIVAAATRLAAENAPEW